ncbi:MAG: tetratricopeptide repeat protein [Methanoregula sp.]
MINHIANTYFVEALHTPALAGVIILAILLICAPVAAADLAEQYYGDGVNFSNAGQYADALASYDKAVFIQPGYADAWLNRGVVLENLGRYSEAVDSYDKAIVLQPSFAQAWFNRGVALRKLGRYVDAIASYDRAIAISPSYAEAWLNRGVALDYLGRYDEAIASYDKVIALQPNLTTARENRDIALTKQSRFNPTTIGLLAFIVIVIAGLVIWYTKPQTLFDKNPFHKKPEQPKEEEKKPEKKPGEKKLYYGTIPEESRLHTLASLCGVMNVAGVSILDDPEKVSALLDEYSQGRYEQERTVLILALKDNIPQELLKPHRGFTLVNTAVRLRKRLVENHKMPEDLARWAIETWAKALDMGKK